MFCHYNPACTGFPEPDANTNRGTYPTTNGHLNKKKKILWANTIFCKVVQVIDLNTINVSLFFRSKSIGYVFS